jgi:hypothetical protein
MDAVNTRKINAMLVWVKYPEDNWIFRIENPTEEQIEVLESANGIGDDIEAIHKIAAAVGDKKRTEACPGWDSIWVDKKLVDIMLSPTDRIYACGFVGANNEKKEGWNG